MVRWKAVIVKPPAIATADCVGCPLKCVFCWSNAPRDNPSSIGRFYSPHEIFKGLDACAKKHGYTQLRVSGNEPTLGRDHLLRLLELVEGHGGYTFILETNGILLGYDVEYAKALSRFSRVHVRVSLKGTNSNEFAMLTGAVPEGFELQLKALKNLINAGVSCHPAVMLSFSTDEGLNELLERIKGIDVSLAENLEEEYVFLYPHVERRLKAAGITPRLAYSPSDIPKELV
ncbi:MAG: radical SAM protein [Candidatus Nezhaarchaeales archaeon]